MLHLPHRLSSSSEFVFLSAFGFGDITLIEKKKKELVHWQRLHMPRGIPMQIGVN